MAIEFGMLQQIKAKNITANGSQGGQSAQTITKAENIFQEYEQYKTQLTQAEQNGGETGSTSNMAFGTPSMSVAELEVKMAECEAEFAKYYAIMNQSAEPQPTGSPENKDDKNKIPPKNFSGLMA